MVVRTNCFFAHAPFVVNHIMYDCMCLSSMLFEVKCSDNLALAQYRIGEPGHIYLLLHMAVHIGLQIYIDIYIYVYIILFI